ncbi:MAG: Zn-dependent exopeptidase M28 [Proteobacteria bacterium]|nr:Zn-dependent exopeptidase M28 [Pseudomonadota bacterium]
MKTAPLIEFIEAQSDFRGRVAGSEAERTCQATFAGRMDRIGLDAVVEGAVCPPPLPNILILHAGVFLGALLLSLARPIPGTLLSFVATLSFYGELRGRPRILRWFLLKRITGNMVARLRKPDARGKVLVVAHADVASSSALFHPWVKRWTTHREQPGRTLHPGTLVLAAGAAQTIAAAEQGSRADISAFALTLFLGAAFIHVGLLVLALDWWRSPPVEGAIDNASGLAVAWGLAKQIARQPLQNTELWVVATGDREPEAGGMRAFLTQFRRHLDPDTTYVINIDEVGLGKLHIVTAEGRWARLPYRPTLPGLAERVAAGPEFDGIGEAEVVGTTDAGVATEAGLRAVTLTSMIDGERPMLLHTHDDVAAAVDPESLGEALRFAVALVRAVDDHLADAPIPAILVDESQ